MFQAKISVPTLATSLVLALSAIYLGIQPAHAASSPDINTTSFAELDANSDGAIDAKEASVIPALADALAKFDADKDGKLSAQEYAAASVGLKNPQQ